MTPSVSIGLSAEVGGGRRIAAPVAFAGRPFFVPLDPIIYPVFEDLANQADK
jgi:hypothetical protein